jgi:hypothetical protein
VVEVDREDTKRHYYESERSPSKIMSTEANELNPWQKRAAKERRERQTEMIYCPGCRRYRWATIKGSFR